MDIRPESNRNATSHAQERLEDYAKNLAQGKAKAQATPEHLEAAQQDASPRTKETAADQLDLSPTARLLARGAEVDSARKALVAELKIAYGNGSLNTPERIQAAAERLLGD